jgi:hypothetical protein
MNTLRKHIGKNIVIALALLGMGSAAIGVQAQSQPQEGRQASAQTQEQRQAKKAEFVAKRQARLHDLLKITPAQEGAWNNYLAATKPAPRASQDERVAAAGLSAPARMEQRIAHAKQRIATMESHQAALTTFYAALTPEQKKVLDEQAARPPHGGHHRSGMKG